MAAPDAVSSPPEPPVPRIRLQRFLASCGLGSRRACEEFITAGRVSVDGRVVDRLGATVDPARQQVSFDGELLRIERKKYYVLNKPRGILCTHSDPAGRPRVVDLFPANSPRLFTVGRLDEESEGLILVTNDGDLAQRLAHPRYRIYRTYHVHVAGVPNRPILEALKEGMHFAEGKFRVHSVKMFKKQGESSHLELVLTEGQNREVRRLLARVGHKVLRLKRIAFGPIQLDRLKRGEFRELTHRELGDLHAILQRNAEGSRTERPARSRPVRTPADRRPASAARQTPAAPGGPRRHKPPVRAPRPKSAVARRGPKRPRGGRR